MGGMHLKRLGTTVLEDN